MNTDLKSYLELVEASRTRTIEEMFTSANDIPRIYSFTKSPGGDVICSPFGSFTDPYEGLAMFAHQTNKDVVALALTCSGWGAQNDTEEEARAIPPSENPDRESVRLELIVNIRNEFYSRVSFPENSKQPPMETWSPVDGEESEVIAGDLLEAIRASLHFHRLSEDDMKHIFESFRKLLDDIDDDTTPDD